MPQNLKPPLTFFFFLTNCRPQSLPSFFFNHAPPILDLYSRHRPPSQAITFLPAVVQPSLRLPILEAQSSSVALKPLLFDQPSPSHANPSRTLCIPPPCLGVGRNFPSFCMSHLDPTLCIIIDYLTGLIESLLPYVKRAIDSASDSPFTVSFCGTLQEKRSTIAR
uniref:Uncharacterized protein n=1 Tax=Cucumis melo TaxID=3656 RepID=A0A9I9EJR4_CUCME